MQESHIIDKLKQRDQEAFKWLVDSYQTKVINLANAYLHSLQEAEDIAQDVFIEIFDSVHKFRSESTISTWIYRITVNKSLNRRKRLMRLSFFGIGAFFNENSQSEITPLAPESNSPDHGIHNEEDKKALHQAINRLPAQQKTAFLLNKYELLSYKEIAEVMNTSMSAVESLLFRAKSNMRRHLSSYINQNRS